MRPHRPRPVEVEPPAEAGARDGLAYALFLPDGEPAGGVVILHGAGSCKESHFDFARACRAAGFAAVAFDARGHGASEGPMDGRALRDVARVAGLLPAQAPLALRGSSMGGWFALVAGAALDAAAVVAICPASAAMLRRGLAQPGRFTFAADAPALASLLADHEDEAAAATLRERLLLLHAEGDEQVPVDHSRALHASAPGSRLVAVPGGHHRSVQHDPELQALALRFLQRRFATAA
ncbi:MAG TPA: alpha/beta fold hydrolase [Solirubrobacteraceae bacterium]|nr:alpha/beta fold hydrolase [Solirubrobacteraceae bacterium]